MEKGTPECKNKIIEELKKNFIIFSVNKFARFKSFLRLLFFFLSNVIEKSLIYSDEIYRDWVIKLLIDEGNEFYN